MDVKTLSILATVWIVLFVALIVWHAIEMLVHLIKSPRCPDCGDWLEIPLWRPEGLLECRSCGRTIWDHELEAYRERQTSRGD